MAPARPPRQAVKPARRKPNPHHVHKTHAPFIPHTNGKLHVAKHFLQPVRHKP
jgi:hypothetical protein